MKTVGQIFKKNRLEKKISLKRVAAATKIRQEYLEALEEDAWEKLPSLTSAKGFLRNYAKFLGLSPLVMLAIFRRDSARDRNQKIFLPGGVKPLGKTRFSWNPKLTLITVVAVVFFGLMVYLGYQYFSLVRNPTLKIISPSEREWVDESQTEIL
jgi:cytoskeleton protein RodZ